MQSFYQTQLIAIKQLCDNPDIINLLQSKPDKTQPIALLILREATNATQSNNEKTRAEDFAFLQAKVKRIKQVIESELANKAAILRKGAAASYYAERTDRAKDAIM